MEVSKMGLKILKFLKKESDEYWINDSGVGNGRLATCPYRELKDMFPRCAYTTLSFELLSLMDQKLICTNLEEPFVFPRADKLDNNVTKFGLTGKGRACLEQRIFMILSKYVPFTISVISVVISFITLFLKINGK
ncbi:hypothetical protein ACDN41_12155 [Priestia aryabhattai]|uniref:hypothetical protein n=1 Tax=Priestia aryabhattai TaxID=412384 RepID=UPI00353221D2